MEALLQSANDTIFSVWFLIGAALVFFMQCGFAMVETGFTRAKNAGNIIMKNLMDFCIGTVVFSLLGRKFHPQGKARWTSDAIRPSGTLSSRLDQR